MNQLIDDQTQLFYQDSTEKNKISIRSTTLAKKTITSIENQKIFLNVSDELDYDITITKMMRTKNLNNQTA